MRTFQRFLADEGTDPGQKQVAVNVDFAWGVRIPMRDGVHLNATLYKPKGDEPLPAVFTLTPYISDTYHERAYYFAQHGYAFLLVDCRGRGNSGGHFEPFVNEGRDGYDIIQWLGVQPWCDGNVSMWGGSYAGFDQWMALKEFPSQLKTIVPAAAAHAGVDFPFFKNIFYSYEMQWLTFTSGVTPNANLFNEQSFWIEKFRELYLGQRPFKELDQVVGNASTHFQTWLAHPTPDEYWARMALTPEEYKRIEAPVLTITGHYDGDQPGAMAYYRNHMRWGTEQARQQHYLVIGPWDHAGTRTPQREFGGLEFAEVGVIDLNKLHKEWYDWTLKDGQKPEFLKQRVAYYVMGAEHWKYADSLDEIASVRNRLYLDSGGGGANDVFHSGALSEAAPASSGPDGYIYDPLDLRPAELERQEVKSYLTDQRYDLQLFGNGLIYHSAPFIEDLEISGYVRLVAWISLDVTDTDFLVELSEVLLDGRRILLTQDMLRARYRSSLESEELVKPGEINRYEFDGFTFFSRRVASGSRLRLSIKSVNSIYYQKNYNSGGVIAEESARDARPAHVMLYHDAEHASYLELPVGES